jgi:hypothetical protein
MRTHGAIKGFTIRLLSHNATSRHNCKNVIFGEETSKNDHILGRSNITNNACHIHKELLRCKNIEGKNHYNNKRRGKFFR